jgi:urease accessory protein
MGDRGELSPAALGRLMTWLSPAFPVGAFTYSHGLEWAIEEGSVTGAADLAQWIADILRHGAGRTDVLLAAEAYRAALAGDAPRLDAAAELGLALQPSRERRLEAGAQGRAFSTAIADTWGAPRLISLVARRAPDPVVYAAALGVAAADHDLPLAAVAEGLLTAFAANLVSAAVRAVPLGQTDGLRVIRDLAPQVSETAAEALAAPFATLGGVALRADIASMLHETQYTRLFRS